MAFDNQLPERIVVKGNRSLLYSVFRNLTDNAIAYAGEGRTITLEAKEQGNKWHFIFRDNGQGVPPEHLARLFERFYRVDKTEPQPSLFQRFSISKSEIVRDVIDISKKNFFYA